MYRSIDMLFRIGTSLCRAVFSRIIGLRFAYGKYRVVQGHFMSFAVAGDACTFYIWAIDGR